MAAGSSSSGASDTASTARLTEYLDFRRELTPGRKTQIWYVFSRRHGNVLGTIRWYGRWRQYAFFPAEGTLYNVTCLQEIAAFTAELMAQRR